jgi:hypothetical protein
VISDHRRVERRRLAALERLLADEREHATSPAPVVLDLLPLNADPERLSPCRTAAGLLLLLGLPEAISFVQRDQHLVILVRTGRDL